MDNFNDELLAFLQASPTPFHAVRTMAERLQAGGFERLNEGDAWQLRAGGRYYVTRNDSSIIAFIHGRDDPTNAGLRMAGAHTDSPCLKVKPNPEIQSQGYWQLGVEVYGGALLNPWFDRDLGLAGRVTTLDKRGRISSELLDFGRPIAVIPSLAIHLDRDANNGRTVNPQTHLPPVLMRAEGDAPALSFKALLAQELRKTVGKADKAAENPAGTVLDYDLFFYDTQAPALVGLHREFIAAARLDNLLSCYVGLQALLGAGDAVSSLLVCNDHEEVGSVSACGAQGPMLKSFLERLVPAAEARNRMLERSLMISVDNAHGVHPNFKDRHDSQHGPLLNDGPVIKVNANQRYATSGETSGLFRHLCQQVDVAVQSFVVRTDLACGSTIGPITAAEIGVRTLDVGVPTFAMHSIRELAGSRDAQALCRVLGHFYAVPQLPW
ncbi:M18 family aminopeptidase [Exilibacterium tricleocarpae]|uniref:M18 family aminopeptidase n=1 Tax=Exilibacterium tricleocarpae TaxID=2591008 RepID=A0A545U4B5_9GAMM|nr:M18 family aminopeptidase [Exilibacterium tricleocarpae]